MKKIMIIIGILFFGLSMFTAAQVEQGKWFLSGSSDLTFYTGSERYKYGDDDSEKSMNLYELNFMPRVGYDVIDNLPVGLNFDLELYGEKDADDGDKYTETFMSIGPFARYYFLEKDNFMPFVDASIGFGTDRWKYEGDEEPEKLSYMVYAIGAGASYFFADHVALDLFLGYEHEVYSYKEEGEDGEEVKDKYIYGQFVTYLGLIVMIGD
jgi:opacity protein-like surface antigen